MRNAFLAALSELAARDPRIVFLTGDLGYTAVEPFAERFPKRFFNVGVAEQNMLGLATGLAEGGFIPFAYSITTFASLRAYEFFRNGAVMHHLPVRVIGVGGGFEYGTNGLTHYGLEDIGVMRLQPGLTVVAPADGPQTRMALERTWDLPGPVYYRLGKDDKTIVPGLSGRFESGRTQPIRDGKDVLILTMGAVTMDVLTAAQELGSQGIDCAVTVVAALHPAPLEDLLKQLGSYDLVVTVEAHYLNGGLGSLVCEIVAEHGLGCRVVRCGVSGLPDGISGSTRFMHRKYGLAGEPLVNRIRTEISSR
jgi:transketolase